jgi:hypothetical protein
MATDAKKTAPGTLFENQVSPELVETHIAVKFIPASMVPSADEAMELQDPL